MVHDLTALDRPGLQPYTALAVVLFALTVLVVLYLVVLRPAR